MYLTTVQNDKYVDKTVAEFHVGESKQPCNSKKDGQWEPASYPDPVETKSYRLIRPSTEITYLGILPAQKLLKFRRYFCEFSSDAHPHCTVHRY